MEFKRIIWIAAAALLLASCIYERPDNSGCPQLNLAIEFPRTEPSTRAVEGEVPASEAENAINDLSIWVFNHETKALITDPLITDDAANLPSGGGVRKYALPVTRQFLLTRPRVDVFVLVNSGSIGSVLALSNNRDEALWDELSNAVFGGDELYSTVNPITSVPAGGLPMSGVGLNREISGEEPSLTVSTVSVGRAVSKLRYIFSQMYTENNTEEEYAIQKVVLDGNQIPQEEYVFSPDAHHVVPDNYIPAAMETPWPEGAELASSDSPELFSYAGQDGPTYERLIDYGILSGSLTDCGTYYLRESDKALTGTVYYSITTKGLNGEPDVTENKTMPFSMAAPGDFARNHTWTLYGYFISNRTLQLAVSVLPWDMNKYTIEFSTSSLQVTQKFTVEDNSATIVPLGGNEYNVFLDTQRAAKGFLYVTTPQGGTLQIIPEGSAADLAAFSVTPAEAHIDPSYQGGRIDISIDRNRSYTGDTRDRTITLSFKAYTPDDREIAGASECIDQIYHFYL